MIKSLVDYPSPTEEYAIVERMTGVLEPVQRVITTSELIDLQREADKVYVDPALIDYAVHLATATRFPQKFGLPELERYVTYGASPGASTNLILTARALPYVKGRDYVIPQNVLDMALDVMRHRLALSFEVLSDNVTADDLLGIVLKRIPIPTVPLREG